MAMDADAAMSIAPGGLNPARLQRTIFIFAFHQADMPLLDATQRAFCMRGLSIKKHPVSVPLTGCV
ncbi:hypothetical protein ACW6AV_002405 [Edwardsiella piscicida]|nr:hypothetical protein BXA22_00420 [Edwardsiella piscicida]